MSNLAAMLRLPANLKSTQWQILAGPILILLILSMMVLPLPAFILDLLFTFNIALSIMVLLVAMFTQRTLEFAAFPTILLFTTLLRLALNVASTRIILMEGHTGAAAAGKVVEAFGHFLVGGNFAIGIVVFVILVIINFMVITKGAGRIAEVGARFVLDGMPGKQMAIDADLNAGLIGEDEAKKRRSEVTQEADFYGSMDGASKFVRGDAIAGILIMVINVVGGLLVGVLQHGMSMGHAAERPIPAGFFEKFKVAGVVDVLVNVEMISTNFDLCLHSAITLRCCYKYRGHNWYDLFSLAKNCHYAN